MGFTSGLNRIFLKFSKKPVRAAEGLQSESVGRGPYPIMLVRTAYIVRIYRAIYRSDISCYISFGYIVRYLPAPAPQSFFLTKFVFFLTKFTQ